MFIIILLLEFNEITFIGHVGFRKAYESVEKSIY